MPHRPTAYPGFAVYHEGPDLVAVVSTGVEVWHLSVTGIIMNRTWVNIGITWMKPNFEDASLPVEKLGGLEMYINQEKVGRYTYYIAGMILLVFPGRQQTHVFCHQIGNYDLVPAHGPAQDHNYPGSAPSLFAK